MIGIYASYIDSMHSAAANVNDARRAKRLPGHQCFGLFS